MPNPTENADLAVSPPKNQRGPGAIGRWVDRFLIGCLVLVVAILTATSAPAVLGRPFGGTMLLTHMMASGALVFGLPVFAFAMIRHFLPQHPIARSHAAGFLLTVMAGLLTIASVFACMLPIPSTDQMHRLMQVHKIAGLTMTPAIVLLLIGLRLTRSASHHHS
ncbi:hypothetical protein [Roseiconus lacunae]|uniref:hypothetical protein n=1 Tax=Roseiconus lacunae TaxID=2605694 RepID=UPI001E433B33|nr:hypothetical protein [Roseiconus lacunae]MCD0459319.1 hypothetical protein [Roseiconus lacunae]